MSKEFLGRGWHFPVSIDTKGKIEISEYEEDIRQSIRIILLTNKGERMMRPDFGAGLREFVFAKMDPTTLGAIQAAVRDALVNWESRIQLFSVKVTPDHSDIGRLDIEIEYVVRATNTRSNLVFPFYLEEV